MILSVKSSNLMTSSSESCLGLGLTYPTANNSVRLTVLIQMLRKYKWESQYAKLSLGAGKGRLLREVMFLRRNTKGKSKVLSRGFCFRDSEAEQRAL